MMECFPGHQKRKPRKIERKSRQEIVIQGDDMIQDSSLIFSCKPKLQWLSFNYIIRY